jgi:predicted PurR-regulated permease PerM
LHCAAPGGSPGKAEPTHSSAEPPPDGREVVHVHRRRGPAAPDASPPVRSRIGGWPIAAALAIVAILLYAVRYALLPFVFAAAIGFVTDPLIVAMQRRSGAPRWVAAAFAYLMLLALASLLGYAIGINAARDLLPLAEQAPAIARNLIEQVAGPNGIVLFGATYTADDLMNAITAGFREVTAIGVVAKAGGLTIAALFGLTLTIVLTPYFMISGPRLAAGGIWLIPPERRRSVVEVLPKIVPVLRRYLIGLVLVVIYTSTVAWIGFGPVFRLSNAVLLAIAVGVLELVPVIGPLSSATLVGLVAVQQASLHTAILLVGFVIALRLSVDNLVGPLVLGSATRLHPVVIIAGFTCGAMLFGVLGLLLAVPAAVCIKITLEHYYAEPIKPEES